MKVAALAFACLILAVSGRTLLQDGGENDGRHSRPESPAYKVLNRTGTFEVREYENATWAVAFGRSRFLTDFAAISANFALAKYFKGGNVEHEAIDFTVPLVGTVLRPPPPHPPKNRSLDEAEGKHGKHHHHHHHPRGPPAVAVAAYLPQKFQKNPPQPDCPRVKLLHTNTTKVYAHRYGGWSFSWVIGREIRHLAIALKDEGICAFKGKFFIATYDSPWKVFNRHNEVLWVMRPKHRNDTAADELSSGLDSLDVETLFPEEFPEVEPEDFVVEGKPNEVVEQLDDLPTGQEQMAVADDNAVVQQQVLDMPASFLQEAMGKIPVSYLPVQQEVV